jgi:hypothetical protein
MTFLLSNWKLCLIAFLIALCSLFYSLWQSSESKLSKMKAAGEYAQQEKERIETEQKRVLKEVSNAWYNYVPKVRKDAVAAYIAKYGDRVCDSGKVPVPGASQGASVLHGTEQERVSGPDRFIENCAEDALFRIQVRTWVAGNGLKVE